MADLVEFARQNNQGVNAIFCFFSQAVEDTHLVIPPNFPFKAVKKLLSDYSSKFHNDPIIVRVMIAGRSGILMLMDEGSTIDIIFATQYDTFQIPPQHLQ